jgi:hypothetical protein
MRPGEIVAERGEDRDPLCRTLAGRQGVGERYRRGDATLADPGAVQTGGQVLHGVGVTGLHLRHSEIDQELGPAPNPIPELTSGTVSVVRSAITAKVTVNTSGSLAAATVITNGQALASAARRATCTAGHVRVLSHGRSRCVSDSFATKTMKIRAAGTYVVKLAPNPSARRTLALGRTLHVKETLRFRPATGGKPVVTTFTVTVHATKRHQQH